MLLIIIGMFFTMNTKYDALTKLKNVSREPAAQSEESFENMLKTEGFRNKPYDDLTGKELSREDLEAGNYKGTPTIGYGTVIDDKMRESGLDGVDLYSGELTEEQAKKYAGNFGLREEIDNRIQRMKMDLSQDQEDALHEAGYNLGGPQLQKIIDTVKSEGFDAGADRLQLYDKSKGVQLAGLTKRRKDEADRLRNVKTEALRKIKEVK